MDERYLKANNGRGILALGAVLTVAGMIAVLVIIILTFTSGYSNQAINTRSNRGLTKEPTYHDMEGATAIEYSLANRLAALRNINFSTLKSGFEGLATTKNAADPWRKANPYTMMMR